MRGRGVEMVDWSVPSRHVLSPLLTRACLCRQGLARATLLLLLLSLLPAGGATIWSISTRVPSMCESHGVHSREQLTADEYSEQFNN